VPTTHNAATDSSRFVFTEREDSYGFHLEVRDGDAWRAVTAGGNALVAGSSFDLRPSSVSESGDGLEFSGSRAGGLSWNGTVSPSFDS